MALKPILYEKAYTGTTTVKLK